MKLSGSIQKERLRRMMREKKLTADGILFDLDGTLWDATSATEAAWREVLAAHPALRPAESLDRDGIRRHMGMTNESLAGVFFPDLPKDEAMALIGESCRIENDLLAGRGGTPYPGEEETLRLLRHRGFRLFVVSNCQDGYIETFLSFHGTGGLIEGYAASGGSGRTKGESIRDLIGAFGLSSPVLVGDTSHDLAGAKENGIPFIYCAYGFGERSGTEKADSWDRRISDIRELPDCLRRKR